MISATKIVLDETSQTWQIFIPKKKTFTAVLAFYKERREFIRPAKKFPLEFKEINGEYCISFPFELAAKNAIPDRETIWRFLIQTKNEEFEIKAENPLSFETIVSNECFHTFAFEFPEKAFTFTSRPKVFKTMLQKFDFTEKKINLTIRFEADFPVDGLTGTLLLKRRTRPELYHFYEQTKSFDIGKINGGEASLSIPRDAFSTDFLIDATNNIDPVIELISSYTKSKQVYIEIDPAAKMMIAKKIQLKEPYDSSLEAYVTGSNRLSFYYRKELNKKAELTSLKEGLGNYQLSFKFSERLKPQSFVLKRRDKKFSAVEYLEEALFKLDKGFRSYSVKLPKNSIYPLKTYNPHEIWDAFIRTETGLDLPIFAPNDIQLGAKFEDVNNGEYRLRMKRNGIGNLLFNFIAAPAKNGDPKPIVVMGTCFSRNAFNSSDYFNPNYKSFFNVAFTQTHTSLISATTPKYQGEIPFKKHAASISANEMSYIQDDVRKDFFERLEEANPAYFLFDLYPDAIRPIIWLDEKSAVTGSYILEGTKLFDDIPVHHILDHTNDDAYFKIWQKHADEFIKRLTQIIPQERIILNKGGFTYTYYDQTGKIATYPNKMAIEKAQYLWDRLNNYVLSIAPNVRVIDFQNKGYIGDFYYPFGHSFSHFESDYYRDFLKELIYIDQTSQFLDS